MASGEDKKQDAAVTAELLAPDGWVKKFTPKKGGGTPQRNAIVFISPTGEEIKNKRQLDKYLKSNPGGPTASDFDWGTGDTPRRSSRLSGKSKAGESSASGSPAKRRKKSTPEGAEGKKSSTDAVAYEATDEKDPDVSAVEAKEAGDEEVTATEEEAIPENPVPEKESELVVEETESGKAETKTEAEVVTEPPTVETQNASDAVEDMNVDVGDKEAVVEDKETPTEIKEAVVEDEETPTVIQEAIIEEKETLIEIKEPVPENPISEKVEVITESELVMEMSDFGKAETETEANVFPAESSALGTQNGNDIVMGYGSFDVGEAAVDDKEAPKGLYDAGKPEAIVEDEAPKGVYDAGKPTEQESTKGSLEM